MPSQNPMCRQVCLLEECRALQEHHRDGEEPRGAKELVTFQIGLPDCGSGC